MIVGSFGGGAFAAARCAAIPDPMHTEEDSVMTREELLGCIAERYSAEPEYPWGDENCIFRHESNRKWFYHMNKEHWLSILLDGTAEDGLIRELLEISWELTRPRSKAPRP